MKVDPSKGILNESDIATLVELINSVKRDNMVIVDVGTYQGFSASLFAQETADKKNVKIYTVDRYEPFESAETYGNEKVAREYVEQLGFKNIEFIKMDSSKFGQTLKPESVDFIFIDADHAYEAVLADLFIYYRALKTGGVICGHDFDYKSEITDEVLTEIRRAVKQNRKADMVEVEKYGFVHAGVIAALYDYFGRGFDIPQATLESRASIWKVTK
jgi:predicted O-methyltransferase YrrM